MPKNKKVHSNVNVGIPLRRSNRHKRGLIVLKVDSDVNDSVSAPNTTPVSFFNTASVELPADANELYQKIRPVAHGHRIVKNTRSDQSYIWNSEPFESGEDVDREWLTQKDHFQEIKVYGLHTYGGYWSFFRPSMDEIVKMGAEIIRKNDVVFVGTRPCDENGNVSYDITRCFDKSKDMHRGCTTFWVLNTNKEEN